MSITFFEFIQQIARYPILMLSVTLTLGVILVNGWTDAPNAIASCVATRALPVKQSIVMAAVFNFLGVLMMTSINASVAKTIYHMVDFRGETNAAMIALCAAMFAIVVWATGAWAFGIPTSEGHALIAGLSGAAIALQGGWSGIIWSEWVKVLYGLVLAIVMSFGLGALFARLTKFLFRNVQKRKTTSFFKKAQVLGAASMAFMHGAHDGQKFMGIFLLQVFLVQGYDSTTTLQMPVWLMLLCSVVMAIGTYVGGYRIIKSMGMDMVHLSTYQGFSADAVSSTTILVSSLFGLPVSTTHVKATAIMGVGVSEKLSSVNWNVARDMALTWILTFPGCGLLGYVTAWLFLRLVG